MDMLKTVTKNASKEYKCSSCCGDGPTNSKCAENNISLLHVINEDNPVKPSHRLMSEEDKARPNCINNELLASVPYEAVSCRKFEICSYPLL